MSAKLQEGLGIAAVDLSLISTGKVTLKPDTEGDGRRVREGEENEMIQIVEYQGRRIRRNRLKSRADENGMKMIVFLFCFLKLELRSGRKGNGFVSERWSRSVDINRSKNERRKKIKKRRHK